MVEPCSLANSRKANSGIPSPLQSVATRSGLPGDHHGARGALDAQCSHGIVRRLQRQQGWERRGLRGQSRLRAKLRCPSRLRVRRGRPSVASSNYGGRSDSETFVFDQLSPPSLSPACCHTLIPGARSHPPLPPLTMAPAIYQLLPLHVGYDFELLLFTSSPPQSPLLPESLHPRRAQWCIQSPRPPPPCPMCWHLVPFALAGPPTRPLVK